MIAVDPPASLLETAAAFAEDLLHQLYLLQRVMDRPPSLSSQVRLWAARSALRMTTRIVDGLHRSEYSRVSDVSADHQEDSVFETWSADQIQALQKASDLPVIVYRGASCAGAKKA
jgi:hypothetical protein